MATSPRTFLGLPTELRLEVYCHILTDTIFNGYTSDISGIYLACHTTYTEFKPMVDYVRTILDVKHACEEVESEMGGTIDVELPRDYPFLQPPTELILWVPATAFTDIEGYSGIGNLLRPIFELPLNIVTLRSVSYTHL